VGTGDTVTVGQNGGLSSILGDVLLQSSPGQVPKQVTLDDSLVNTGLSVTLGSDPTFSYLVNGLANSSQGRGRIGLALDPATPVTLKAGAGATPTNDVFQPHDFTNAPAISINAGNGVNTLDYSAYKGDVKVNLGLGTATGLAGISGIQNVTGGQGNNLIVGNGQGDILTGGLGRNILIGGAGPATLIGGPSDNILIAGHTDYDTDVTALDALFAEWTRTGANSDFATRVQNLMNGVGPNGQYMLTAQTVYSAGAPNSLIGGNGHNWFFLTPQEDSVSNADDADVYTYL
jgi:hypothetical protein